MPVVLSMLTTPYLATTWYWGTTDSSTLLWGRNFFWAITDNGLISDEVIFPWCVFQGTLVDEIEMKCIAMYLIYIVVSLDKITKKLPQWKLISCPRKCPPQLPTLLNYFIDDSHLKSSQLTRNILFFIRPFEKRTYYAVAMSVRLSVCPSVRPSVRLRFPDFSSTCFEISIWNLVYTFSRWYDISRLSCITIGSIWPSLQSKVGHTHFLQSWPHKSRWILQIWCIGGPLYTSWHKFRFL